MALLSLRSCAVSPVVTSTTCDTDSEDRFGFDIFRYPYQSTGDYVYLRAAVIVCLSSNSASVCQTECTACSSVRKRRETLEQIQRTEFYVTAGPFQIRKPDQGLCLKNSCVQLSKGCQVDKMISQTPEIGTPKMKVSVAGGGDGGGKCGKIPYMGYIGMCGPKRYDFSAIWV